jgi:hypothetical protein
MKQLITIEDIIKFRPISKDIPPERINPYIQEAQRIDVGQLLGRALYYDFVSKFDVTGDAMYTAYQELLNGIAYAINGRTYNYEGLSPCLSYFSLARFCENNPINVTKYGLVAKLDDSSTSLDPLIIKQAITGLRSVAIQYQTDVEQFLVDKASTYPLFASAESISTNKTGVKFF